MTRSVSRNLKKSTSVFLLSRECSLLFFRCLFEMISSLTLTVISLNTSALKEKETPLEPCNQERQLVEIAKA